MEEIKKEGFCGRCWAVLPAGNIECPQCGRPVAAAEDHQGAASSGQRVGKAAEPSGGADRRRASIYFGTVVALFIIIAAGLLTVQVNGFIQTVRPGAGPPRTARSARADRYGLEDFVGKWRVTKAPDEWNAKGQSFEFVREGEKIVIEGGAGGEGRIEFAPKVPGQIEGDLGNDRFKAPFTIWLSTDKKKLILIVTPPIGPPFKAEAVRSGGMAEFLGG